jgi:hypothetical protein
VDHAFVVIDGWFTLFIRGDAGGQDLVECLGLIRVEFSISVLVELCKRIVEHLRQWAGIVDRRHDFFLGQWIWVSWQCGKYSIEVEVFEGSTFNTGLIQHPGGGIQLAT